MRVTMPASCRSTRRKQVRGPQQGDTAQKAVEHCFADQAFRPFAEELDFDAVLLRDCNRRVSVGHGVIESHARSPVGFDVLHPGVDLLACCCHHAERVTAVGEQAFRASYRSFVTKLHEGKLAADNLYEVKPEGGGFLDILKAALSLSVWPFCLHARPDDCGYRRAHREESLTRGKNAGPGQRRRRSRLCVRSSREQTFAAAEREAPALADQHAELVLAHERRHRARQRDAAAPIETQHNLVDKRLAAPAWRVLRRIDPQLRRGAPRDQQHRALIKCRARERRQRQRGATSWGFLAVSDAARFRPA